MNKKFSFTITISGVDHEADDFEDRLFDAGCDDATPLVRGGEVIMWFHREAASFDEAVSSAIEAIESMEGGG